MRHTTESVAVLTAIAFAFLPGPTLFASGRTVRFEGVKARDQSSETIERGLLRSDLKTLRGLRDRTSLWLISAPGTVWEREVAPKLSTALSRDPADFERALQSVPSHVLRAGPSIEGGQLRVKLDGGGDGLITVHLPMLLSNEGAGAALVNSPHPNKAHFLAGFELKAGGPGVTAVHLPRGLRPLSRGLFPRVPLLPTPTGATWIGLGEKDAVGDETRELRKRLGKMQTIPVVSMGDLRPTPRRSSSLTKSLRSVRLDAESLATPEGVYRTLTQTPSSWTTEQRTVRHPSRYLAVGAPIVVGTDTSEASMVMGVIAFYTPLVLTLEEAPLFLGVEPRAFAEAVHAGELPFLRDGSEVLFYRPWLTRWRAGKSQKPAGKKWLPGEAPLQVAAWGERYKLRSLARAAEGALPMRLTSVPTSERENLIDDAQVAWAIAWTEDIASWLKHFEPDLKQGKQPPEWAFAPDEGGVLLEGRFKLSADAPVSAGPSYLQGMGMRSPSGAGGGAEQLRGSAGGQATAAGGSALSVDIVDVFMSDAFCPVGRRADAGIEIALDGVPDGQLAALQVEWDLTMDGRSVRRDAFPARKETGTHEIDFEVSCPDTSGPAKLDVVIVDPGGSIAAELALDLDVRAYGGRSFAALRMPSPKQCIGTQLSGGDEDFSVSSTKGLSPNQVQGAVRGFQAQTLRCYEGGGGNGTVQLELHVGCDGVVMSSEVTADTTGDSDFADCVASTFTFAPFPAHDREGGALFEVPLRYD